MQQSILDQVKKPGSNPEHSRDAVENMLLQLRTLINYENSKKTKQIKVKKDQIAYQENMPKQLIEHGEPQNIH